MVRITKKQKLENDKKYKHVVLKLFLTEGHEALTHARVAQELSISISTLQGYFPTVDVMKRVVHEHIIPLMIESLDFSYPSTFHDSWEKALTEKPFRHSIELMFFHASQQSTVRDINLQIKEEFQKVIGANFCSDIQQAIDLAVGRSLFTLLYCADSSVGEL
ncbi:TetR/AcrR family transcriptional regulator [Vibrio splendidus]|uniref:TetR/AcrR family transcriptional regulator n=1 Tax=Vibrio splendidus TaxID=29497 RepID=A0A0H3ZJ69_VIBSP|nr:hypothetical protein [Vibrio splendidus]